jgi:hypothetical protein
VISSIDAGKTGAKASMKPGRPAVAFGSLDGVASRW